MNSPKPHPHADILRAIADEKQIEYRGVDRAWYPINLYGLAHSTPNGEFRIAPETVVINGVECPKPLSDGSFGVRIDSGTRGCRTVYFASEDDRRTVFNALCKPFKSEGV